MQAVTSSLTRQLDEMNNKLSSNSSSANNQFKGLPQIVAGDLRHVLQAERGGYKTMSAHTNQLAMTCYNIAEAMPPGAIVAAPNGQMIGKLDYYQAAANLNPHIKLYWLKIAENLGDDEKIKVGRQTYSKSECLSRSEPLPAMALWSQKAKQGQTSAQQGGCAEYMQNRHSEGK